MFLEYFTIFIIIFKSEYLIHYFSQNSNVRIVKKLFNIFLLNHMYLPA